MRRINREDIGWLAFVSFIVAGLVLLGWTISNAPPIHASNIDIPGYFRAQNAGTPLTMRNGFNCSTGMTCSDDATNKVTLITASGTGPSANQNIRSVGAGFDGGGVALISGKTVYVTAPFTCTIAAWNITADTGTATIDVWKIATGTAIPTIANTIVASAAPAISTGTAIHSTTLTGWTTAVTANDIFGFNLKAVASATELSIVLQCNATT